VAFSATHADKSSYSEKLSYCEEDIVSIEKKDKSRFKWKRVAILAGVILFFPAILYLFWGMHEAHASNAAFSKFSNAIIAKQYEQAYSLTSIEFQRATEENQFENQQRNLMSKLGDLKKVERNSFDTEEHRDGWTSLISATFSYERAEKQFDVQMKKEGNQWKVYGYSDQ